MKHIHQIWIGDDPIPTKYLDWAKRWKALNEDWEYTLWKDDDIIPLMKSLQVYGFWQSLDKKVEKIDMAKYVILFARGGLYVDMDTVPYLPISEFDLRSPFTFWKESLDPLVWKSSAITDYVANKNIEFDPIATSIIYSSVPGARMLYDFILHTIDNYKESKSPSLENFGVMGIGKWIRGLDSIKVEYEEYLNRRYTTGAKMVHYYDRNWLPDLIVNHGIEML